MIKALDNCDVVGDNLILTKLKTDYEESIMKKGDRVEITEGEEPFFSAGDKATLDRIATVMLISAWKKGGLSLS